METLESTESISPLTAARQSLIAAVARWRELNGRNWKRQEVSQARVAEALGECHTWRKVVQLIEREERRRGR